MKTIRLARINKELSQREVAISLGVSFTEYSRLENDLIICTDQSLLNRINKVLGVEILFIELFNHAGVYFSYSYFDYSIKKYFFKYTSDITPRITIDLMTGKRKGVVRSSRYYDFFSEMQLEMFELIDSLLSSL
ncbi:MAG: helix-turn-helix transcriptional regulator [Okeania sp. SIO3B5]|uniref:helix-turn-helix domain-containing protein n=1 Tax=Okeania sp. SIO3B5 TaxID=2607811 RepID=UPI0013FFC52A|nr:helix-turn-helix transcriptional regulator [Okeania sp. SIO3B5]NEO57406.1 helix-turn-helix transcriptional regulator [Okeania sp. SIO3B5]